MHRRTYLASRPGRLIAGLRETRSNSVLFLLDEIDKLGENKYSNPMSSLLEVLDPEQNSHFIDRYLEFPFDLSKCLFICTANDPDRLHEALKDRMEIIPFREYTFEERQKILNDYLLPKVVNKYNLNHFNIIFEEELIPVLAKESSLRKIEKKIERLYKKAAVNIEINNESKQKINISFMEKYYITDKIKMTKLVGF